MKNVILGAMFALCIPLGTFAQSFEGMVVYKTVVESKDRSQSEKMVQMMGGTMEYYFGKGKMKMLSTDSKTMDWTIIDNEAKKYT